MNKINKHNQLNIGDILIRNEKNLSIIKHHGIYVGKHNNIDIVAENQKGYGVRYVSMEDFLNGEKLVRIERNNLTEFEKRKLIERINKEIISNKNYDLVNYNCEHFVNKMLSGVAKSPQITKAIVGIGLLGLGYILYKKKNTTQHFV